MGIQHYEDGKRTDILHTFNDEIVNDDWSIRAQINMGELATRIGAKQAFDNRGREIWSDNFESDPIKWGISVTNGSTISRQTTTAWKDTTSIRFQHPIAALPTAILTKQLYNPGTGRYGVETSVSTDRVDWTNLRLQLNYWTGALGVEAFVKIGGTTGEIFYWGSTGVSVSLGEYVCLNSDIHFWHKLKLVIDINKQEYVRILVDGVEFDMAGIPMRSFANASCNRLQAMLYSSGGGVVEQNIYWDNFIMTHLEP